jgi:hypothetical protein
VIQEPVPTDEQIAAYELHINPTTGAMKLRKAGDDAFVDCGGAEDGWSIADPFVFASTDAPTFTFTIAGLDRTSRYTPGTRIKLTQATGGVKYFIVTAVAFATDTTVTVYGGTDYTLNNEAISSPSYSRMKGPVGFPLDPSKWRQTFTDVTFRTQGAPVNGTFYNIGSLSLVVPIGLWNLEYHAYADVVGSVGTADIQVTLSTSASSESDATLSTRWLNQVGAAAIRIFAPARRERILSLAAKATYFLIWRTNAASMTNIDLRNDINACFIYATSAYL